MKLLLLIGVFAEPLGVDLSDFSTNVFVRGGLEAVFETFENPLVAGFMGL